jgi:hypothetical protein
VGKREVHLKTGFRAARLEALGLAFRGAFADSGFPLFPFGGMALEVTTLLGSQGFRVNMRRSDGTRGKRGASPDEEYRVRPDVSLMRHLTRQLDQRV